MPAAGAGDTFPREFGAYTLVEEIGQGPRGTAWLAERHSADSSKAESGDKERIELRDTSPRNGTRRVVLKIYPAGMPVDRACLERFRSGGEDSIRSPNLLPLEDLFETEDGSVVCVYPWLQGDTLEEVLRELRKGQSERPSLSPFSVGPDGELHPAYLAHAVQAVAEVARGLEKVHAENRTHSRISTANLIFSPNGRLVLTDFGGIAGGEHLETLPYRAPEQLLVDEVGIESPRSDVYALGAVLYELATFRKPYETLAEDHPETARAPGNAAELRQRILRRKLMPPRELREEIPIALEQCLLMALATEPEDRYSSAGRFSEDLGRFLQGEAPLAERVIAVRESIETAAKPTWRRAGRWIAALILLALVGGALFLGSKTRQWERDQLHAKVMTAWNSGNLEEALDRIEALHRLDPSDKDALRIKNMVTRERAERDKRNRALLVAQENAQRIERNESRARQANELLIEALQAYRRGDVEAASRAVRESESLLPEVERLGVLDDNLEAQARLEPLVRDLSDSRVNVRVAALRQLDADIAGEKRSRDTVGIAALFLKSDNLAESRAALAVFRHAPDSELLLSSLGIGDDAPPQTIDGDLFIELTRTLTSIGDESAGKLLDQWTLDAAEELDLVAGRGSVDLPPNLTVDVSRSSMRPFVAAWLEVHSTRHPERIVSAADRILDRADLAGNLVAALGKSGHEEAPERVLQTIRELPFEAGSRGLEALVELRAADELLELGQSELPVAYRARVVDRLGSEFIDEPTVRKGLVRLLERSSDPVLRRHVFESLDDIDGSDGFDPSPVIASSIGDLDLEPLALEWLDRTVPSVRARAGLRLIENPRPEIRKRGVAAIASDDSSDVLPELLLRVFDDRSKVREAALEALSLRKDAANAKRFLAQSAEEARALARELAESRASQGKGDTAAGQQVLDELRAKVESWRQRIRKGE